MSTVRCFLLALIAAGATAAAAQTEAPAPETPAPETAAPETPETPATKGAEAADDEGSAFQVSVSQILTHRDMHRWERHVRGFRREHNFALSAGVSSGTWSVQWQGESEPRKFDNSGIYTRFQYSFHLQLYKGFGYILGSGTGYHYESVDQRRVYRPVAALQFPGLLAGLVLNVNPVLRFSAAAEAYLERHNGIEGRTTQGKEQKIFVTLQGYDASVAADVFYDLSWALRLEAHIRHLEYTKPSDPDGGAFPVDARLHKDDRWLGMGLVYHLL